MGYSILELVLRRLREANFRADAAFPGQMFPKISDTVAAVHIEQVDRANMTVTVEVNVICPAAMGGTECEVQALRATEVLRWAGAVCVQKGCTYDGVAQVYVVQVLATFTGVTEAESCTIWPGFYCYIDDLIQKFAVCFTAERVTGAQAEYVMGEKDPVGISLGSSLWSIQLEELIPSGSYEAEDPEGEFTLQIYGEQQTETYSGCCWTSVKREFSRQGLRRTRKGYALKKEVV